MKGVAHRAGALALTTLTALTVLTQACSGDGPSAAEPGATGPGIRPIAGAVVDDTILAQPTQALIVEVRGGDGKPAHGVTVRFESRAPSDTTRRSERAVYVCVLVAPQCGPAVAPNAPGNDSQFAADTADASGRAKALIRLGTVAGPARVAISVPELGLRDSITVTVRAGAPARVRLGVRDTALVVGGSYSPRPAVQDRFGNARAESATLQVDSHLELLSTGAVAGRRTGPGRVLARFGAMSDSAAVSVLPSGTLAAYEAVGAFGDAIVTANADGSGLRRLSTQFGSDIGGWPTISADGSTVVFHAGTLQQLWVADASGRRRLTTSAAREVYPRFSADGVWVYYSTQTSGTFGDLTVLARVRSDGTGFEPLATLVAGAEYGSLLQPDPSPDGTRVVYLSTRNGSYTLTVMDLATRRSLSIGAGCSGPRWSPDGAHISCIGAGRGIDVMRADGTDRRTLAGEYIDEANWSPDGAALITRQYFGGMMLVDATTGEAMRLPFGQNWFQPVFRR